MAATKTKTRTLYVKDQDEPVWSKAEQHVKAGAAESLSALVTELLKREVQRMDKSAELKEQRMERILIEGDFATHEGSVNKTVAVTGRYLVEDFGETYSVILTSKGYLFVLEATRDDILITNTHASFRDMKNGTALVDGREVSLPSEYPADLLAQVAEEVGEEYVEELDL